jgi:hypothetical protein
LPPESVVGVGWRQGRGVGLMNPIRSARFGRILALAFVLVVFSAPGRADEPRPGTRVSRYDVATRDDLLFSQLVAPTLVGDVAEWSNSLLGGLRTCQFLDQVVRWHGRGAGRIVVIWDNASWHTSALVREHAEMLGVELMALPTSSPDLKPIEGLWAWIREKMTQGHCHASLKALRVACQEFIARINGDAMAVVDRLWPKFDLDPEYEAKLLVST